MQIPAHIHQCYRQIRQTEAVEEFFVSDQRVLEKEHRAQNQQHYGDGGNVEAFFPPQAFPNHALRIVFRAGIGGGDVARRRACVGNDGVARRRRGSLNRRRRINHHRLAVGVVHGKFFGQQVVQINGYKRFVLHADFALHHQLQMPRLGCVQFFVFGNHKQRHFFKLGRACGFQFQQASVLRVGKAEAAVVLHHLNAVKNTAAHITRAFP